MRLSCCRPFHIMSYHTALLPFMKKLSAVIRKLAQALKQGGKILIRDYGRWVGGWIPIQSSVYHVIGLQELCLSYACIVRCDRYDEAQLRFTSKSKLDTHFYVRQDGTCAHYFDVEELASLCETEGFQREECCYIRRQCANRKQKRARCRVWVHLKLVKL